MNQQAKAASPGAGKYRNPLMSSAMAGDLDRARERGNKTFTVYAPNGQPMYEVAKASIADVLARDMGRGWSWR